MIPIEEKHLLVFGDLRKCYMQLYVFTVFIPDLSFTGSAMFCSQRRVWPAFPETAVASFVALESTDMWYSWAFSGGEVLVDGSVLILFTNVPLLRLARRTEQVVLFFDATFSSAPHFVQVKKIVILFYFCISALVGYVFTISCFFFLRFLMWLSKWEEL